MNIYERAIYTWGREAQILMALEEMSELSTLLFHSLRENRTEKPDNWQISEEIVDVEIMMEQLKYIFHSRKEIIGMKDMKLKRLEKRLNEEMVKRLNEGFDTVRK